VSLNTKIIYRVVTKIIKNLALCGGGVYGYAGVGVLKELVKYPDQIKISNISGVSVGSKKCDKNDIFYHIFEAFPTENFGLSEPKTSEKTI